MITDGIRALHVLRSEGIRVNVTLVFSPAQALIAAKGGAHFVSPFVGRLDDTAEDGLGTLREIVEIYRTQNFSTQVLAASLRHPIHVVQAAKIGAQIATIPFKVFEQLFKHPLTDRGLRTFLTDWKKASRVLGEIIDRNRRVAVER
jgi:transaldolase